MCTCTVFILNVEVLGIERKALGVASSTFLPWATSSDLCYHLIFTIPWNCNFYLLDIKLTTAGKGNSTVQS